MGPPWVASGRKRLSEFPRAGAERQALCEPPTFLCFEPREFRIGQNVRDVNGSAFQNGSPGNRPAVELIHRKSLHVLAIFALEAGERDNLEAIVLDTRYVCLVGATKPCRRFDERVEHGLQIEGRAADDLEHVGGCGLLLQRFAQLFEQAGNCTPTSLLPGKRGVAETKKAPSRFGSPVPVRRR